MRVMVLVKSTANAERFTMTPENRAMMEDGALLTNWS